MMVVSVFGNMRNPGVFLSTLLVFVTLYGSIQTQETLSSDNDAKNYVARFLTSSNNKISQLGNNIAILQNNVNSIIQAINNAKANANNLATSAKSSVASSLNIISSAASIASTASQTCADSVVSRKAKLTNQANEQIAAAIQSSNLFQSVETEIASINARLSNNTASIKLTALQNCVTNVVVTLNNVQLVVNCLNGVYNAYVNYINAEGNLIASQFNIVQSSTVLNGLVSMFNKIITNASQAAWVEAEGILDCAGLSATKRVESANQRITSTNNQVDSYLRGYTADLLNAIANTKTILNSNINNATQSIDSLLAKVNSYATYFSYIAPDKIAQIKKEVEQVTKNSTAQLDRIKQVYAEAVAAFDALNTSLPQIYNEYKANFTAISSVNFTALISADITQRLNTAELQNTLNSYINQLVAAANKATSRISAKIDEYNLLINKVNAVSNIRLNAEFVFAINATRSIETIYLLGGVEFKYSPSTVVVQLNNSGPVLSVVNIQTQLTNLYNQVKIKLDGFTSSYNNSLQQLLNPTKVLIDNVLNNNPYINKVDVNVAFYKIYNDAQVKILAGINLALINASNINNNNFKINITGQLKAVEDAIKICFNNADQYAAIVCANKVIADFNTYIAQLQLETQKYNVDLAGLPTLVQTTITNILQNASKEANDLYNNVRSQIQPTNISSEIEKIKIDKQIYIDTKLQNIQNAINNIKNSFNVSIGVSVEPFLAPYKELLISLNSSFPNSNLSQLISLLPSLKDQTVNNIKPVIYNIINQYLPSVQTSFDNIVLDLNVKFPAINETTVKTNCAKYSGSFNYSSCVDTQINGFKLYVSGVNSTLDNLFGSLAQTNRSINLNVSNVIQTELQNVFTVSTDKAVNLLNYSVGIFINLPKITINNYVTDLIKQINNYSVDVGRLVLDASTPVQIAFDNLQQQYPYINFEKTNFTLQTLKDNLNNDLNKYLNDILKQVYNLQNQTNGINFDVQQFEQKLKNCFNSNNDINLVISVCVLPLINEVNVELKNKSDKLNNLLNEVKGINVTIDNQINLILNNYSVIANEVIRTSADEASTTDYIRAIERDIALKINETLTTLDTIKTGVNTLKQLGTDYLIKVQPLIEESIRPLVVAINATLRVSPNVNLTKQQDYLQKLVNDAKVKANATVLNEVNKYLANISALNNEYNQVELEFNNKIAEVNRVNLTVRCNRNSTTEIQFRICVENFYNEFKVYYNDLTTKINNLNNKASNLTVTIDANINADLNIVLGQTFNLSNNASIDIYNKNNITGNDIIEFALEGGIQTYNITPILLTVLQLSSSAQELDRRNIYARSYANQTLFSSGGAIYDIVGVGRALCGQQSVDRQLKEANDKIAQETAYVFDNAPQLLEKIKELFELSNEVNETLFYRVSLLDENKLRAKCNTDNKFAVYQCIMVEVNKFGAYYDAEIIKTRNYSRYGNQELRTGSEALTKWRNEYVLPKAAVIVEELKQYAEDFYKKCGVTPEKLINYSLSVAKSHYNTFQPRITSNFTEIVVLVDRITNRNYTGYNISSRLESSVQPLYTAINAVLNSANKSLITDDIRLAVNYLIQNATGQFGAVLANFTIQSAIYKQQALNLINNRDLIQNNHTYSYLYNRCYDPSSQLPLTELVTCNNNQTYRNIFIVGNNNTLTALLAIKADLNNFDSFTQLINNAADNIDREFLKNVYTFAYRLYKIAGLPIPPEVAAQVELNRCVRGVTVSQYYCVVTT